MNLPNTPKAKKLIDELSFGYYSHTRLNAVERLGELQESNKEIVQALAAAMVLDEDENVRNAAQKVLNTPIHQNIAKQNPGLIKQAPEKISKEQKQIEKETEEKYTQLFLLRRHRERMYTLTGFAISILFLGVVIITQSDLIIRIGGGIGFVALVGFGWLSWKNWRCPACDSWLSSRKASVSPIFSDGPLNCPHCGVKLL